MKMFLKIYLGEIHIQKGFSIQILESWSLIWKGWIGSAVLFLYLKTWRVPYCWFLVLRTDFFKISASFYGL